MSATPLASWRDGTAKQAILDFVSNATTQGGPDFVAPADRIAAFDNDGTLWVEQPLPPQFDFVFGKWAQEIKADPALAQQQPYKAILERDPGFFQGLATQEPEVVAALLAAFGRSWAGTTPGEFEAQVREWTTTAKQPKLGVSYLDLVYKPCWNCSNCCKPTDPGVRLLRRWPGLHAGLRRGNLGCEQGKRDRVRCRVHLHRRRRDRPR